jgi:hypothetical protein
LGFGIIDGRFGSIQGLGANFLSVFVGDHRSPTFGPHNLPHDAGTDFVSLVHVALLSRWGASYAFGHGFSRFLRYCVGSRITAWTRGIIDDFPRRRWRRFDGWRRRGGAVGFDRRRDWLGRVRGLLGLDEQGLADGHENGATRCSQ